MNKIDRVIILGGTHGDEMSGIRLVKKWLNNPSSLSSHSPSFQITPFISNPEAVRLCQRYKDCDLNRQFTKENCSMKNLSENQPYEVRRAHEMHKLFADDVSDQSSQGTVLLDLHNTTSNMKCTLILSDAAEIFSMHLAAYVQQKFEKDICNILVLGNRNYPTSRNMVKYGLGIEVGPQPQGVLRSDICDLQEKAVHYALEFVKKFNEGFVCEPCSVSTFTILSRVDYPDSERRFDKAVPTAMIHENLQDKDYHSLNLSDPVLKTIDDEVLTLSDVIEPGMTSREPMYPVFVNEAAYYEKNLAFWLTTKKVYDLPLLQASGCA